MGTKTWKVTATSGDWTDPGNWQENEAPEPGDDITIPVGDPDTTPAPVAPSFNAGKLYLQGNILEGGPITVQTDLQWTGGMLDAQIVLAASGSIIVSSTSVLTGSISNQGVLDVSGPGTLPMGDGATIVNSGVMTVQPGVTFDHGGGAFPGIIQQGTSLTFVSAESATGPQVVFQDGAMYLLLKSGTTIFDAAVQFKDGGNLQLAGGDLSGQGRVIISSGGYLSQTMPASIASPLTLMLDGGVVQAGPLAQLPVALTVHGTLLMSSGQLVGRVIIADPGQVDWPAQNQSLMEQCSLVITDHMTVTGGQEINIGNGAEILVAGRLGFAGAATVTGRITNVGLVTIDGDPGAVTLSSQSTLETTDTSAPHRAELGPWPFPASPVRRGAVTIGSGRLTTAADLSGNLTITSGTVHVTRVGTSATPALDVGQITIGQQGTLRAHGLIGSDVTSDGRIEILDGDPASLQVTSLALSDSARLELPAGSWTAGTAPLSVTQRLDAAGVLACPAPPAPPVTAVLVSAGSLFEVFGRHDIPGATGVTSTYDTSSVQLSLAGTSVLGFDHNFWPDKDTLDPPPPDVGDTGGWLMQNLYETTDLGFVGFYLASPKVENHTDASWMTKYMQLTGQGWGVIPIYAGKVGVKKPGVSLPTWTNAAAQAEASTASQLAAQAGLPKESRIYYDIESSSSVGYGAAKLVPYLEAWGDALTILGYQPGLYAPAGLSQSLHAKRAGVPLWLAGHQKPPPPPYPFADDGQLQAVTVGDAVGNATRLPFPPDVWQWSIGNVAQWSFLDTTGTTRTVKPTKMTDWDFDTASSADPSTAQGAASKQYNTVTGLSTAQPTFTGGGAGSANVTLSRAAAHPNGALVLFGASSGEIQGPASVVVPAGAASASVAFYVHLVDSSTPVTLTAWTHRQGIAKAASTQVTVAPA